MKRMLLLAIVVLPLAVWAEDEDTNGPLFSEFMLLPRDSGHQASFADRYDSVTSDGVVYSGIFVQLMIAPQPLQLINPLAPTEYGNGEQNLSMDPVTKRPMGLNLFAINF